MHTASGTVYLVRHGRTALNVGNRFRGLEDVPLDEVGLAEVEATGERLKGAIDPDRPPTQIFTSPMSRTRSTAAAVARHFDLDPIPDDRLLDLDYGRWTAMTHEEAEALDAEAYRTFREDPYRACPPGGEPLRTVADRIAQIQDEVAATLDGGCAVLVTHDLPIVLLLGLGSDQPDAPWHFDVPTASITEMAVEGASTDLSTTPVRIGWKD
jgi:broad specificity phosphatase PhoE